MIVRGFRFGVFDLDATTGELRKRGIRVRLARQSTEILRLMAERPGELVSRDDIQHRLWPNGEVVEYEHSINTAVARLREVLGESATSPRIIETVPGRGYRLLVPVETIGDPEAGSAALSAASQAGESAASQTSPGPAPAPAPLQGPPSPTPHRRRTSVDAGACWPCGPPSP